MPFGAQIEDDGSVRFALWAPDASAVELLLEREGGERSLPMTDDGEGWFRLSTARARPGDLYRFRPGGTIPVPDPASRFQPRDVHGPSEIIDPRAFAWDDRRPGRAFHEAVFYEIHVGVFTPEGTFRAAARRLDHLERLGVTALELMPVSDFPGARNWGYDGAYPFAPDARYGRPDDLKHLVQEAHHRGLMVFLDVVHNHFGPEGNYLHLYAKDFFTSRVQTPWGDALDFEGPRARWVRSFFVHNALFWLEEYRFDGLRFDAAHAVFDRSTPHILEETAAAARRIEDGKRSVHLVLENDANEARFLARDETGSPSAFDAQWNDDLHHALHVLLTGEKRGYYRDYHPDPAALLERCLREGFAYQGEPSPFRNGRPRGEPSAHLSPSAFVSFLQNHDQIGNRAFGERIDALAPAPAVEAALAVLLLAPPPPLLFMGQEWGTLRPFLYFCDFEESLARRVREGRRREFRDFPAFADPRARETIPDPVSPGTRTRCLLDWETLDTPGGSRRAGLIRRLLDLRRRIVVPGLPGARALPRPGRRRATGVVSVAWRLGTGTILSLAANLSGRDAGLDPPSGEVVASVPEPAAGAARRGRLPAWSAVWTTSREETS